MRTATMGRITSSLDATVFIIVAASHKVSLDEGVWEGAVGVVVVVVWTDMRGVGAEFDAAVVRGVAVESERERWRGVGFFRP